MDARPDFDILNFHPKTTVSNLWRKTDPIEYTTENKATFERPQSHNVPSAGNQSDSPQSKLSEGVRLSIESPVAENDDISADFSTNPPTSPPTQQQQQQQLIKRSVLPQSINSQFTEVLLEARGTMNEKSIELADTQLALAKFQVQSRLLKSEHERKQFQLRFDAEQERYKRDRH